MLKIISYNRFVELSRAEARGHKNRARLIEIRKCLFTIARLRSNRKYREAEIEWNKLLENERSYLFLEEISANTITADKITINPITPDYKGTL